MACSGMPAHAKSVFRVLKECGDLRPDRAAQVVVHLPCASVEFRLAGRMTVDGRQALPAGPLRPTAELHTPVVRRRTSCVRRRADLALPAANTGTRPKGDAAIENLMAAKRPFPSRVQAAAEPLGSVFGTFFLPLPLSRRASGDGTGGRTAAGRDNTSHPAPAPKNSLRRRRVSSAFICRKTLQTI